MTTTCWDKAKRFSEQRRAIQCTPGRHPIHSQAPPATSPWDGSPRSCAKRDPITFGLKNRYKAPQKQHHSDLRFYATFRQVTNTNINWWQMHKDKKETGSLMLLAAMVCICLAFLVPCSAQTSASSPSVPIAMDYPVRSCSSPLSKMKGRGGDAVGTGAGVIMRLSRRKSRGLFQM